MPVQFQDYYEILGVKRDATAKEIKSAYRRLARKWHPDLRPAHEKKEAEEQFKRVNEAYEVLQDPDKRARYDRLGQNWAHGQDFQAPPDMNGFHFYTSGGGGFGEGGFSDFFEMLFGGRRPGAAAGGGFRPAGSGFRTDGGGFQTAAVRGRDVESEIELTLEEAYRGVSRTLRVAGSAVCPACGGTGSGGQNFCPRCGGTGGVATETTLEVRIPPGVQEGSRIRLKGQGGEGLGGGGRGDLFLKVRLLPHPHFRLRGRDIESETRLYPDQAALGDRIPVPTLDGPVTVTVPPGSGHGRKLRLKGKGFPLPDGGRGDQYVRLVIDFPSPSTGEEEKLYRRLRELRERGGEK